eukprot:gene6338-2962_t
MEYSHKSPTGAQRGPEALPPEDGGDPRECERKEVTNMCNATGKVVGRPQRKQKEKVLLEAREPIAAYGDGQTGAAEEGRGPSQPRGGGGGERALEGKIKKSARSRIAKGRDRRTRKKGTQV